ncbi:MAG: major capsid protein [Actinobacteria bacterium]|nr:major capsid protein [Actinomycetota bacterium]
MLTMDIFRSDPFSDVTLTEALNRAPYLPGFLGGMGIFEHEPVRTLTVAIEKLEDRLSVIPTSPRGAPVTRREGDKRDIRDFRTVRIAKGDTIYAHEIQDVRAFGSQSELMQLQDEMARRLRSLRNDVMLTHENMMLGAIQGKVLDADGTVIQNWFTEWKIPEPAEVDFELDDAATDVRKKCAGVIRSIARASGGAFTMSTQVHCLASDEFYDALTSHANVRAAYLNWTAAADLRENNAFESFRFGGVTFHNYRGTDDNSTVATAANKAHFFPVGAPGIFKVAYSPGEDFDYAKTPGKPWYVKSIPDKDRNTKVDLEVYSYPLHICTHPAVLRKAKMA